MENQWKICSFYYLTLQDPEILREYSNQPADGVAHGA